MAHAMAMKKLQKAFRPELISAAGLGFLASGAWLALGAAAGLAAIGAALLLVGWMLED